MTKWKILACKMVDCRDSTNAESRKDAVESQSCATIPYEAPQKSRKKLFSQKPFGESTEFVGGLA